MIAINKRDRNVRIEYRVVEGAHLSKKQMAPLFQVLAKKFKNKRPTPQELVKAAKPKTSPIHNLFEWNDARAALGHRLTRAQYLLRSINIVRVDVRTEKVLSPPVRWTTPTEFDVTNRHRIVTYTPTQRMDNADIGVVLERARREFSCWLARYDSYVEFHDYFDGLIAEFRRTEKRMDAIKPAPK